MQKFIFYILVGLFIILESCEGQKAQFDEAAQAKVITEATQTLHDYYNQMCRYGLLSEFDFLDSSKDFYWLPPGTKQTMNFDTVAWIIRRNAATLDTICVTWNTLEVKAVAFDTAHYSGELHSWSLSMAGDTSVVDMLESGILIRREQGWRLLGGETKIKGDEGK